MDEIKAKLAELSDLINAFVVPTPAPEVADEDVEVDIVTKSGVTKKFVLSADAPAA